MFIKQYKIIPADTSNTIGFNSYSLACSASFLQSKIIRSQTGFGPNHLENQQYLKITKYTKTTKPASRAGFHLLVESHGFEPWPTESESGMLPLHYDSSPFGECKGKTLFYFCQFLEEKYCLVDLMGSKSPGIKIFRGKRLSIFLISSIKQLKSIIHIALISHPKSQILTSNIS